MHTDQYCDLHVHDDLIAKLIDCFHIAETTITNIQSLTEQLNNHNTDYLSHPNLRKKIEELKHDDCTADKLDDLLEKHNKSWSAHNKQLASIRTGIDELNNKVTNTKLDFDNANSKLDEHIELRKAADKELQNQTNSFKSIFASKLNEHNTSETAHKNRFDDVDTKIENTVTQLRDKLNTHLVSPSAHTDFRTIVTNTCSDTKVQIDNAMMTSTEQTITGNKTFISDIRNTDTFLGQRLLLNNNVNTNMDFTSNNIYSGGAFIEGTSMQDNIWKRIALYEDTQSLANTAQNNATNNITNTAAAWSRDRQMVPDGTRWGFALNTTYTAPHNGFLRVEHSGRALDPWADWGINAYIIYINGGVAEQFNLIISEKESLGYNSYILKNYRYGNVLYPVRAGWTWNITRSVGNLVPSYMEYIQCYF